MYVFFENGEPVYVVWSNKMRSRTREHGSDSSDRNSATFGFRLLREELNDPQGRAEDIENVHKDEYRQHRERVRDMTFRAVSITINCNRPSLKSTPSSRWVLLPSTTTLKPNERRRA